MDKIIADLIFAYINKDEDNPHDFERETVINACKYLLSKPYDYGYTMRFFYSVMEGMKNV